MLVAFRKLRLTLLVKGELPICVKLLTKSKFIQLNYFETVSLEKPRKVGERVWKTFLCAKFSFSHADSQHDNFGSCKHVDSSLTFTSLF